MDRRSAALSTVAERRPAVLLVPTLVVARAVVAWAVVARAVVAALRASPRPPAPPEWG